MAELSGLAKEKFRERVDRVGIRRPRVLRSRANANPNATVHCGGACAATPPRAGILGCGTATGER